MLNIVKQYVNAVNFLCLFGFFLVVTDKGLGDRCILTLSLRDIKMTKHYIFLKSTR